MDAPVDFPGTNMENSLKLKGFRAFKYDFPASGSSSFSRRHFYKIVLSVGRVIINHADCSFDLDGVYLFFANPHIPYAVELLGERQTGYACIFTEAFIKPLESNESLQQSPLFKVSGSPAFKLDKQQHIKIAGIFDGMISEMTTEYLYKDYLIRNYLQLIIHEALRMQPPVHFLQFKNASLRITNSFLELLEGQFPVENRQMHLTLKTARDCADHLCIHVNYLNRAVKEVTGKSTSVYIAQRVTTEAVTMLRHTDWSIAEIAYALGFEHPNYFSNFFKKMTGNIPKAFRLS